MRQIFGPATERVLAFLADLWLLSPEQMTTVTAAWKQASELERAEAWAELHRIASGEDWDQILAAASVARRQAMDAAYLLHQIDWEFWAAAWDAAAAVAARERIGSGYYVLARPLMAVMPSLSESQVDARVPAQRGERRESEGRGDAGRSQASDQPRNEPSNEPGSQPGNQPGNQASKRSQAGSQARSTGKKLAGGGDEEPVPAAV